MVSAIGYLLIPIGLRPTLAASHFCALRYSPASIECDQTDGVSNSTTAGDVSDKTLDCQ